MTTLLTCHYICFARHEICVGGIFTSFLFFFSSRFLWLLNISVKRWDEEKAFALLLLRGWLWKSDLYVWYLRGFYMCLWLNSLGNIWRLPILVTSQVSAVYYTDQSGFLPHHTIKFKSEWSCIWGKLPIARFFHLAWNLDIHSPRDKCSLLHTQIVISVGAYNAEIIPEVQHLYIFQLFLYFFWKTRLVSHFPFLKTKLQKCVALIIM